ncbi:MAG TPA: aldo/keto reductase [Burkholderiaceae bacterium]|nr:aldo/keto reductase [Burkholderiaceae bacterium]
MRYCKLPCGDEIPALGLGTWRMGESPRRRAAEVAAVRNALAMGYRLIDTAEMYGEGGAETVVGIAVADALRAGEVRRDELFIVSKVYPHNASRTGTLTACDRSRSRLRLDQIDLYLLHWRGQHPLRETCAAMQQLVADKRIGHWGVSNFDSDDMIELLEVQRDMGIARGTPFSCSANQVYYSLRARGPETSLLPWMRAHHMPLMAYSPIDQGALAAEPQLRDLAKRASTSAAQLALAWVLAHNGVVAIPKAVRDKHLRENLAAEQMHLSTPILTELDRRFPAPRHETPLAAL